MIMDGLCCGGTLLRFKSGGGFLMCPRCLREYDLEGSQIPSMLWQRKELGNFVRRESEASHSGLRSPASSLVRRRG